jgi:hypothetical protein
MPSSPEATACPRSVVADPIMRTIELGETITDAAVDEKQTPTQRRAALTRGLTTRVAAGNIRGNIRLLGRRS